MDWQGKTHILSILQEVLQVTVISELFRHLLCSLLILVMPEQETQKHGHIKMHFLTK